MLDVPDPTFCLRASMKLNPLAGDNILAEGEFSLISATDLSRRDGAP
jgi:hypothetical protein